MTTDRKSLVEHWWEGALSQMSLKAALISYGGVTFVNGATAMGVVYVMWAVGWI